MEKNGKILLKKQWKYGKIGKNSDYTNQKWMWIEQKYFISFFLPVSIFAAKKQTHVYVSHWRRYIGIPNYMVDAFGKLLAAAESITISKESLVNLCAVAIMLMAIRLCWK